MQNAIICTFKRGRWTGHRRRESNVTLEREDGRVSVSCCLSCPVSTWVEFKLHSAVIIPGPGLVCFPRLISYCSLTRNFSTVNQNCVCPRGMTWCLVFVLFCCSWSSLEVTFSAFEAVFSHLCFPKPLILLESDQMSLLSSIPPPCWITYQKSDCA